MGTLKNFYHATSTENRESILRGGLKGGPDGMIYLAESRDDALMFMILRFHIKDITIFEIDRKQLDKTKVEESFDHSQEFYGCRGWMYSETIPSQAIVDITQYSRGKDK
jgi:RNA:NAD 2'-phosphotransferase (TPT1/KptA family)